MLHDPSDKVILVRQANKNLDFCRVAMKLSVMNPRLAEVMNLEQPNAERLGALSGLINVGRHEAHFIEVAENARKPRSRIVWGIAMFDPHAHEQRLRRFHRTVSKQEW